VFRDLDVTDLAVVTTCQRARVDLVGVGPDVESEKDRLLHVFHGWAQRVCEDLRQRDVWCDYIDPCSGLPVRSATLRSTDRNWRRRHQLERCRKLLSVYLTLTQTIGSAGDQCLLCSSVTHHWQIALAGAAHALPQALLRGGRHGDVSWLQGSECKLLQGAPRHVQTGRTACEQDSLSSAVSRHISTDFGEIVLQVVLHPHWGTSVYPASLFAKAPLHVLSEVVAMQAGHPAQH
jgi:Methylmalonic aciduria and homocystinuria type D protein